MKKEDISPPLEKYYSLLALQLHHQLYYLYSWHMRQVNQLQVVLQHLKLETSVEVA